MQKLIFDFLVLKVCKKKTGHGLSGSSLTSTNPPNPSKRPKKFKLDKKIY